MEVTLPLGKMSGGEKIRAMEAIWDDLCRNQADIASPSWHEEILSQRSEKVDGGGEGFIDWKAAKQIIRDKTSLRLRSFRLQVRI